MKSTRDRITELESKVTLTNDEMQELIRLKPKEIVSLPGWETTGLLDLQKAMDNLNEIGKRSKHAMEQHCYLEVISLRLQFTEMFLRLYWVGKNQGSKIFEANDKRTFGQLIKDCAKLGMKSEIILQLEDFNQHRINAIHKYLLGGTDYDQLREVCERSIDLVHNMSLYVAKEIGIPLESQT